MPKSRHSRRSKPRTTKKVIRKPEQRLSDIDYYTLPFSALHQELVEELRLARMIRPAEILAKAIATSFPGPYPCEVHWEGLREVLEEIEAHMAAILRSRSVFYWVHVYRRLAPGGADDEGQLLDWTTISLIRDMVESAIQKYGALDGPGEFGLSNEVEPGKVLGGLFESTLEKYVTQADLRTYLRKQLLDRPATVLLEFSKEDLENIYLVEGLAHRYWQITAKMRAVGKDAKLMVVEGPEIRYDRARTPWSLMASFDHRAEKSALFDSSSLGIWIEPREGADKAHSTFTFGTNASNEDVFGIFRKAGLNIEVVEGGHNANFMFHLFDATEFCNRHSYLADEFAKRKGFHLRSLAIVFECISARLINMPEPHLIKAVGHETSVALSMMNLCRRAYSLKGEEVYQQVVEACRERLQSDGNLDAAEAGVEADAIFNALTLSTDNRSIIGIWSRGPRFPILRIDGGYVFDFFGIHRFFHNLFVGVREPKGSRRGYIFEDAFRSALIGDGFTMEVRDFTFHDGTKAEADAVFYIGDALVVVDCLSVWMPLDFDISRPKTMQHRKEAIQSKLADALPRVETLAGNPVGRNFDFSGATEIIALVASPFVEWLWDHSSDLWYREDQPRIMRANELIDWAKARRASLSG